MTTVQIQNNIRIVQLIRRRSIFFGRNDIYFFREKDRLNRTDIGNKKEKFIFEFRKSTLE